jgi:membrane associated rhomboid family serine protease
MATFAMRAAVADLAEPLELSFLGRIRKFLWLSSGIFSAVSFAIAAIGVVAFGHLDGLGTSFLAAIISASVFGATSLHRFGTETA